MESQPRPGPGVFTPVPLCAPNLPISGYSPHLCVPRIREHKWFRNQHFSGGRILAR